MESSTGMRLPDDVIDAARAAIGGGDIRHEFAWMSWAGTVWRLEGASKAVYVKRAADLEDERDRLEWLRGRWPVPELIGLYHGFGDDWLLTHAVRGVPLNDRSVTWDGQKTAKFMGKTLRELHRVDASDCPFGGPPKGGEVLVHGDYCSPNVLVEDGRLSALVDVGRARVADPRVDFAAAVWGLQYNFGPGHAPAFLEAYGAPPMSEREIERLRRSYTKR